MFYNIVWHEKEYEKQYYHRFSLQTEQEGRHKYWYGRLLWQVSFKKQKNVCLSQIISLKEYTVLLTLNKRTLLFWGYNSLKMPVSLSERQRLLNLHWTHHVKSQATTVQWVLFSQPPPQTANIHPFKLNKDTELWADIALPQRQRLLNENNDTHTHTTCAWIPCHGQLTLHPFHGWYLKRLVLKFWVFDCPLQQTVDLCWPVFWLTLWRLSFGCCVLVLGLLYCCFDAVLFMFNA